MGRFLPSPGKKAVGSRWFFSVNPDGKVERYKARLVARGYTQTPGVDYQKTFAHVAKMDTVHVILSCVACLDWDLHQLDVKNAFLHGDLDEEVYMTFPPGFVKKGEESLVCRLRIRVKAVTQGLVWQVPQGHGQVWLPTGSL